MRIFKWIVTLVWCLTGLWIVLAWLFEHAADNVDARATAGLAFLPAIPLMAIAILLTLIFAIVRLIRR